MRRKSPFVIVIVFMSVLSFVFTASAGTEVEQWTNAADLALSRNDYAAAVKWYSKAAERGYALAQYNLGAMYGIGMGVQRNDVEAFKWFRKAAEKEFASAQYNLGVMYREGNGVQQNYVEAMKWFRRAAEQGHAGAQNNVGVSYGKGLGVPQNFVLAYMWCSLGATEGDSVSTKNRDLFASWLTPAQLAEAQKLAAEWRPKK